jgi:hypothetical protein
MKTRSVEGDVNDGASTVVHMERYGKVQMHAKKAWTSMIIDKAKITCTCRE